MCVLKVQLCKSPPPRGHWLQILHFVINQSYLSLFFLGRFQHHKALESLIGLLSDQPIDVLVNVVGAIGEFAKVATNRETIRKCNGIKPLINLLTETNEASLIFFCGIKGPLIFKVEYFYIDSYMNMLFVSFPHAHSVFVICSCRCYFCHLPMHIIFLSFTHVHVICVISPCTLYFCHLPMYMLFVSFPHAHYICVIYPCTFYLCHVRRRCSWI